MKSIYLMMLVCLILATGCGVALQPRTLSPDPEYFGLEREKKEGPQVSGPILVANFNTDRQSFFGCGDLPMIVENGELKLEMTDARFQCIGRNLDAINMSNVPLVKIKARIVCEREEDVAVLVRFTDENDTETNYKPEHKPWKVNQESTEFVYDFSEKLVSVNGEFDATAVTKMKVFFNTKSSNDFTGVVYIDEIKFEPKE